MYTLYTFYILGVFDNENNFEYRFIEFQFKLTIITDTVIDIILNRIIIKKNYHHTLVYQ